MATTMRKMLETIRKELENNPALLDAPCISSHSAAGTIEAVYGPWPKETSEEVREGGGLREDDVVAWFFSIDH